jgi:hypothetical protein
VLAAADKWGKVASPSADQWLHRGETTRWPVGYFTKYSSRLW